VKVDLHPIGIVLRSQTTIKGIRFKISKEHWRGTSAFARLPNEVYGVFVRVAANAHSELGCLAAWLAAAARSAHACAAHARTRERWRV
jgi:hypothetical protein